MVFWKQVTMQITLLFHRPLFKHTDLLFVSAAKIALLIFFLFNNILPQCATAR